MKILIVEDQDDLRGVIRMAIENIYGATTLEARSGNDAAAIIAVDGGISLIICDFEMPNGNGASVFKATQNFPKPIPFILCSSREPEECEGISAPLIAGYLQKPFTLNGLKAVLGKWFQSAPAQPAPSGETYFAVRVGAVSRDEPVPADLFLKLNDNNFVRLLNKGDRLNEGSERRFTDSKIDRFYYRTADRNVVIESLLILAFNARRHEKHSAQDYFEISEALHDSGRELITHLGVETRSQQLIATAVQLALKVLAQNTNLKKLILDVHALPGDFGTPHSVLLGYVAGAMACALEWGSEENLHKLAVAAFLHDIPLRDSPLIEIRTLKELAQLPDLKPNDREFYVQHPYTAAQLARQLSPMPADVDTILEQHHEHPNGAGFPEGLSMVKIHPFACLFIVAEDFVTRRLKSPSTPLEDHLMAMLGEYPDSFCRKLIEKNLNAMRA